jgi:hypothetical protein
MNSKSVHDIDGCVRKIGRFEVTARVWENSGKRRIYFSLDMSSGQACFCLDEEVFIKCKNRVGARFEWAIKEAFSLPV